MAKSTNHRGEPQGDAPDWAGPQADPSKPADGTSSGVQAYTVPSTGEVIPMGEASMKLIEWCATRESEDDSTTADAMEQMIADILTAESVEDVLSEQLTVPVEKILGIPVQINGVRVGRTEFADGFPFYALLDCQYGQGMKPHVVSCGAFKVMAQLARMDMLAEWPQVVVFKKAEKPTKQGYYPIALTRPI